MRAARVNRKVNPVGSKVQFLLPAGASRSVSRGFPDGPISTIRHLTAGRRHAVFVPYSSCGYRGNGCQEIDDKGFPAPRNCGSDQGTAPSRDRGQRSAGFPWEMGYRAGTPLSPGPDSSGKCSPRSLCSPAFSSRYACEHSHLRISSPAQEHWSASPDQGTPDSHHRTDRAAAGDLCPAGGTFVWVRLVQLASLPASRRATALRATRRDADCRAHALLDP